MDLDTKIKDQIIKVILGHKKADKIILFGSRARGDSQATSDIDLAVMDKNWTNSDINLTQDALNHQVKTPLEIDLINFYDLKKNRLRELILEEGKVIYESGKN